MVIGTVDSCVYCFRSMINTGTWWFIQLFYVLFQASDQHMNMVIFPIVHIISGLWSNDEWSTPGPGDLSSFVFCSRPVNNIRVWWFIQLCALFQVYGQHLNMVIYPVVCIVPGLWSAPEHGDLSSCVRCSRSMVNTRTWWFIQLCVLFQVYGQHLNMMIYPVVCIVPGLWSTPEHGDLSSCVHCSRPMTNIWTWC